MMMKILLGKNGYESVRYDSPDSLIYIRRYRVTDPADGTVPRHRHEDVEFISVLSGEMSYEAEGKIIRLSADTGIMVNSARFHSVVSATEGCEFLVVLLNPAILCTTKHIEDSYVLPIVRPSGPDHIILDRSDPGLARVLDDLSEACAVFETKKDALSVTMLYFDIWKRIYGYIANDITPPPLHKSTGQRDAGERKSLKLMLEYIYEHYGERITLSDIAAAGHMCRSKCAKLFDTYMHEPPMTFLTNYRTHKALLLLDETSKSILDIAYETGFSTSSYFTEVFKARIGCTPSDYRKSSEKDKTAIREPLSFAYFSDDISE